MKSLLDLVSTMSARPGTFEGSSMSSWRRFLRCSSVCRWVEKVVKWFTTRFCEGCISVYDVGILGWFMVQLLKS